MAGALDHLLVLDLTSHLSGPYCAMLLADHGAEVIKIEPPTGDSARNMPPFVNGESAPFMTWNRNKRSVVLDLKQPADKDALLRPDRPGRHPGGKLPPRRAGPARSRLARPAPAQQAADPRLDLRLRPDRPLQLARRLRPDHPGDVRPHEHQRPRRRAAAPPADRHFRRHRRHVPGVRRSRRGRGAASHRRGPACRDLAAGGRHLAGGV